MSPPERRFHSSQIIIITNFVVVPSVGIKRDECIFLILSAILLDIYFLAASGMATGWTGFYFCLDGISLYFAVFLDEESQDPQSVI